MEPQTDIKPFMLNFFKSMANEERLKVIGVLATAKLSLEEIAARIHTPVATVAHHLENLVELGIVRLEQNSYRLDTRAVEAMARQTLAQQSKQPKAEDFEGEAYERKVLSDFFTKEGKLKALPAQQKKLLVILRYLAKKEFQPGIRYPEKEVNAILLRYFSDPASLRRYLIDNRFLAREKGEYWKVE